MWVIFSGSMVGSCDGGGRGVTFFNLIFVSERETPEFVATF